MAKTVLTICNQATKDLEVVVKKELNKAKKEEALSAELDTQAKDAMKRARACESEVGVARIAISNIKALFGVK